MAPSPTRRIRKLDAPFNRVVHLPGSKSITNRALVCAALAHGTSQLTNVLFADDTEAMLAAIVTLGALVDIDRTRRRVTITGIEGRLPTESITLDARQSGTTARFLLPIAALSPGRVTVDGHEQMRARPMRPLLDALISLGASLEPVGQPGHLPIAVTGGGAGLGNHVSVTGDVSSQFLSGLMLAGPCMPNGLTITVTTELVSRPYVTMTASAMRCFGAAVDEVPGGWHVSPTGYRAVQFAIEPDASAASYFFAAAAITKSTVTAVGLGTNSTQGDMAFVDSLARLGAHVIRESDSTTVIGRDCEGPLSVDMASYSDTAPTLAIVVAASDCDAEFTGIGFIRGKETDRIAAVVTELQRTGVNARETPDGLAITHGGTAHGTTIETYDDHRMAMSFAVLGLVVDGIEITNPDCVNKTFPEFWDVFETLYERPLIVAIDGPAGTGKSTVAKQVAALANIPYLDTGAMYRAVGWLCDRDGTNIDDRAAVAAAAQSAIIDVTHDSVAVDGVDVTAEIRTPHASQMASRVAAIPEVRKILVAQQRRLIAEYGGGVAEGRDIGTVVFPDAPIKIFLTARADVRAERRFAETSDITLEALAEEIRLRDERDSQRVDSPLRPADDAAIMDTSDHTIADVVNQIMALIATHQQENARVE